MVSVTVDVYCPRGSAAPIPVSTGYYTVGYSDPTVPQLYRFPGIVRVAQIAEAGLQRTSQRICEE